MKLLVGIVGVLFFLVQNTFGQCHVNRYLTPVYESARTAEDIVYQGAWALSGLCVSETTTSYDDYDLDVYEPLGDNVDQRPCIVFAHGGSFLFGNKQTNPVPDYCFAMAERGFVVVSINYRKCFNPLSSNSAMRAVYRAVQDLKSAIRFVKAQADVWAIDTSMVFAGGNSAGAIMALHAAYLDEHEREQDLQSTYLHGGLGCLNCIGLHQAIGSKPKAVINLWGGIGDTAWIAPPNDVPVVSFHGTADDVVYYDTNNPFNYPLFPEVSGSGPVHDRLQNQGITELLFTLENEPHEAWNDGNRFNFIVEESSRFLYNEFLKPSTPVLVSDFVVCSDESTTIYFSGAENESVTHCLDFGGGEVMAYGQGYVEVAFAESGEYTVQLFSRNQWGALSDTVYSQIVVVDPPPPFEIEADVDSLFAPLGYAYQWYLNGVLIQGANESYLVPQWPGTYEVTISDDYGCSTDSDEFEWIFTSLSDKQKEFRIYPNPAHDVVNIAASYSGEVQLTVWDTQGVLVLRKSMFPPAAISVASWPQGAYLFVVESEESSLSFRIVVVR